MYRTPRRALALTSALALAMAALSACAKPSTGGDDSSVSDVYEDGRVGDVSELKSIDAFCGDEPLKVALADGTGDNAFRKTARAEFEDEAAKCPNLELLPYADAQNNPQKAISDIKSLVSQGADAIVVFADAGEALLPTLREATKAGVAVVPWTANPGGEPGTDYATFVGHNTVNDGRTWTKWVCQHLGEEGGNLLFLGGTPGNTQSLTELEGIESELEDNDACAGVTLLNQPGKPIDTNWNPAQTQKVVSGLLTKYRDIDAVITDSGDASLGGIRAFKAAGRTLPLWTANDLNGFGCAWKEESAQQPDFNVQTVSSRTWIIRLALRKALASKNGIENTEPEIINIPVYEDSFDEERLPGCDEELPSSAITSADLDADQLKALFK